MDVHKNARLTPLGRERLVKMVLGGQTPEAAATVGVSPATVSRVLKRLGLNKLSALEPAEPPRRYERERPGEMIHIDIKKLGKFDQIGHRITGDRKGQSNSRGVGWEYVHVCIDDASRVAFSKIMKTERKGCAVAFLKAAVAYYASLGVTVERVMTDNGSCYRSSAFAKACRRLHLKHIRTKPYTPRTNGKAERFIQTSLREWAYAQAYPTSQERTAALASWLDHYNTARPHAGLGNGPPAARLRQLQLLCSTQGTVASSRPASINDRCGGLGQGSPKATGGSRRAASLRRPAAAVTLAQAGTLV